MQEIENITAFLNFHVRFYNLEAHKTPQIAMLELNKMISEAKNGRELSFNKFLKKTFIDLKKQLILLTKSEPKAEDIFIEAMQKFWERFVIHENEAPKNPKGYIFMICKNIWLMEKRGHWNKVILKDSFRDDEVMSYHDSDKDDVSESSMRKKSLEIALTTISSKCKELMELSMDASVKLIDCMESLGYETYQALIQAKYNCKKRLIKEVFNALNTIKRGN